MSELNEHIDSRQRTIGKLSASSSTLHFTYVGSEDDEEVEAIVTRDLPPTDRNQSLKDYQLTHRGAGVWDIHANYGGADGTGGDSGGGSEGGAVFIRQNLTVGGSTQHITQSQETIQTRVAGGEVQEDYGCAINYDGTDVKGVDIPGPNYQWSETFTMPNAWITNAYRRDLYLLSRPTMNKDSFRGFDRGEVLFLGATGGPVDITGWELTFNFAASPNLFDFATGFITGINKIGWDYLWFRYAKVAGAAGLIPKAVQANVERLHYWGDFGKLKIGEGELT